MKNTKKNSKLIVKSSKGRIYKKVFYSLAVYGDEEKNAVIKSLDNHWLASGPMVQSFEEKVAKLFGKKYSVAVNSGSSANLLALQSLDIPKGSEIITPACNFSTTVSSIIISGYVPVFVDCVIGRYTINEDLIEKAISKKTKAIMVPQLIGGVCDMAKIKRIATKYKLKIIDDSCDTLAPRLKEKTVARYSDVSTTSFYGSHIITAMGVGGMILTDSKEVRDSCVEYRDWGRVGNDNETFEDRFNFRIDKIPFDSKFIYTKLGYNFKLNEASAAFGLEQLKRLNKFTKKRGENFNDLHVFFSKYEKWFYLPYLIKGADTNWLAFPLTIKENSPFNRYDFLKHLEMNGIQTRVLFSGNITRHPIYKKQKVRIHGKLKNSDIIMASAFLLGCHQGMSKKETGYIKSVAKIFLQRYDSKLLI